PEQPDEARCAECDARLELVRPGKHQHPTCGQTEQPGSAVQGEKAEAKLANAGVFKGHHGLRGLAEADAFWDRQMYGTRLYYGDGGMDYLHRSVLRAAVELLDTTPPPAPAAEQGAKDANQGHADACACLLPGDREC